MTHEKQSGPAPAGLMRLKVVTSPTAKGKEEEKKNEYKRKAYPGGR